jgi:hypothetical protein
MPSLRNEPRPSLSAYRRCRHTERRARRRTNRRALALSRRSRALTKNDITCSQ